MTGYIMIALGLVIIASCLYIYIGILKTKDK